MSRMRRFLKILWVGAFIPIHMSLGIPNSDSNLNILMEDHIHKKYQEKKSIRTREKSESFERRRSMQSNCLQESAKLDCFMNKISERFGDEDNVNEEETHSDSSSDIGPTMPENDDLNDDVNLSHRSKQERIQDDGSPTLEKEKKEILDVVDIRSDSRDSEHEMGLDVSAEIDRLKEERVQPRNNLRGSKEMDKPFFIHGLEFKIQKEELITSTEDNEEIESPPRSPTLSAESFELCGFSRLENDTCFSVLTPEMEPSDRTFHYGEYMCSPNKVYAFGMTFDGHLSICNDNRRIWSVGPFIGPSPFATFRRDGNLVVNNKDDDGSNLDLQTIWSTETDNFPLSTLEILNDGTVQIISASRSIVWETDPNIALSLVLPLPSTHSQDVVSNEEVHVHESVEEPIQEFVQESVREPIEEFENESAQESVQETVQEFITELNKEVVQEPNLDPSHITYRPGELIYNKELDLLLSEGLTGRILAKTDEQVHYSNGSKSKIKFHEQPDAGGCFPTNDGGWYYLSNSESGLHHDQPGGGVGRIHFDKDGGIKEYKMVLKETKQNCGSGITPWNTFITCEERQKGQCWEVHPEEEWKPRATKMGGKEGGRFESAAFDARDMFNLKGFITTDSFNGALHRYSPDSKVLERAIADGDYSDVLHKGGQLDYLQLIPSTKSFRWTKSHEKGKSSAENHFPNAEGIDVHDGFLYFVSKTNKELFTLNLDSLEYNVSSTVSGAFNGQPDQLVRLIPANDDSGEDALLYFLEDGGSNPSGVFARDRFSDRYYTIVEGGDSNPKETTGLAFCDEGKRMIFAFQEEGTIYEIMREDGEPFHGATLDIKYHSPRDSSRDW